MIRFHSSVPRALAVLALALAAGAAAGAGAIDDDRWPEPADARLTLGARYTAHLTELINDFRRRYGLAPLQPASELDAIAAAHTAAMMQMRRISHDGFHNRLLYANSGFCVENVGWNFPHAEALLDRWRVSPGHRKNLLEPNIVRIGIASDHSYVTLFACR